MSLAEDSSSGLEVAWIHTHPTTTFFSGLFGDQGWNNTRAALENRSISAYVAWPNFEIFGMKSGTPLPNGKTPIWKVP
jgi:hypothetical protein